jgi:protein-S-isoprenylcysteine O-methyltransferase Ste14
MQREEGLEMTGPIVTTTAPKRGGLDLKKLVGSGHRIVFFAAPFAAVAFAVQLVDPTRFAVDTPSWLRALAFVGLAAGLLIWAWSAVLILTRVPMDELITSGPYAVVKHPLYTSVGLLVLPSLGILLGTWIGLVLGVALYAGSRLFAPEEEAELRRTFGPAWESYARTVKVRWL